MSSSKPVQDQWPRPREGTRSAPKNIILLLVLLFSYSYFIYRGPQWNADSRLDLTYAIVEQGTVTIDGYHENTQDKSFYNGHYYTDKAPGMSFLAVPIYWLLRQATGDAFTGQLSFVMRQILTLFVVGVPAAAFGVFLYRFLGEFVEAESQRLLLTIAYALGTIAYPFSTVFYSHHLTAIALFASFWLLFKAKPGLLAPVIAGLLAGFAVSAEYPAALGYGLLLAYLASGKKWRAIGAFLAGSAPLLVLVLGYNWYAFGSPLTTGYSYLAGAPQFIEGMRQGIMGLVGPSLASIWGLTLSPYRGLFLASPFLILAIPGFLVWFRRGILRRELLLSLAMVTVYFVVNASYTFWEGGYSPGPRHFIPALPFLAWSVAFALPGPRSLFVTLVIVSLALTLLAIGTNPFPPPEIDNPYMEIYIPILSSGEVNNNWAMVFGLRGILSLLPLALVWLLALLWSLRQPVKG